MTTDAATALAAKLAAVLVPGAGTMAPDTMFVPSTPTNVPVVDVPAPGVMALAATDEPASVEVVDVPVASTMLDSPAIKPPPASVDAVLVPSA